MSTKRPLEASQVDSLPASKKLASSLTSRDDNANMSEVVPPSSDQEVSLINKNKRTTSSPQRKESGVSLAVETNVSGNVTSNNVSTDNPLIDWMSLALAQHNNNSESSRQLSTNLNGLLNWMWTTQQQHPRQQPTSNVSDPITSAAEIPDVLSNQGEDRESSVEVSKVSKMALHFSDKNPNSEAIELNWKYDRPYHNWMYTSKQNPRECLRELRGMVFFQDQKENTVDSMRNSKAADISSVESQHAGWFNISDSKGNDGLSYENIVKRLTMDPFRLGMDLEPVLSRRYEAERIKKVTINKTYLDKNSKERIAYKARLDDEEACCQWGPSLGESYEKTFLVKFTELRDRLCDEKHLVIQKARDRKERRRQRKKERKLKKLQEEASSNVMEDSTQNTPETEQEDSSSTSIV